jgi:hypothetical protein
MLRADKGFSARWGSALRECYCETKRAGSAAVHMGVLTNNPRLVESEARCLVRPPRVRKPNAGLTLTMGYPALSQRGARPMSQSRRD